jgi:hypothetical protein
MGYFRGGGSLYPNVAYPVHPGQQSTQNGDFRAAVPSGDAEFNGVGAMTIGRQTSNKGVDGVPFELNALLKASLGHSTVRWS